MLTYTYVSEGTFALMEKPKPVLQHERDAIVKVTLASICSSDLHIKHGSVPRAVPGITVGHEMVGIVEEVGSAVTNVKPGDRVTVNVETFCGECFFCKKGFVNNCTDQNGGWALGCRIDGGQAEYVRVPFADQGLNKIPDGVTDRQALLVGDVLATGFWAARISEITPEAVSYTHLAPLMSNGAFPDPIHTLKECSLKYNTFTEMNFNRFDFSDGNEIVGSMFAKCEMQLANFKGVELHETEFYQCDLRKADFRDATGYKVDILGSRLKDAKFSLPEAVNLLADLKIKLS